MDYFRYQRFKLFRANLGFFTCTVQTPCLSNRLLDLFHTDRNVQLQQFYSGMAVPVFRSGWTMLNNPASGGTGGTGGTSSAKKNLYHKKSKNKILEQNKL